MVIRQGLQVENLFRRGTPLEGPLRQRSRRSQKMVYLPQATQLPASSSLVVGDVRMRCWLTLLRFNSSSKDVVVVRYYSGCLHYGTRISMLYADLRNTYFFPRDFPDYANTYNVHTRVVPHSLLSTGMATFSHDGRKSSSCLDQASNVV